jgi:hypothetical protein
MKFNLSDFYFVSGIKTQQTSDWQTVRHCWDGLISETQKITTD